MPAATAARGTAPMPDHMPSAHRRYAEWTPERFRRRARQFGPNTEALIAADPGQPAASRAGLPHLPGHPAAVPRHRRRRAPRRSPPGRSRSARSPTRASPRSWSTTSTRQPPARAADGALIVHANIRGSALLPLRRSIMLHHPTLDLLHELGLDGMAKGFGPDRQPRRPARSIMPSGSASCSSTR